MNKQGKFLSYNLESVLENALEGIIVLNNENRIEFINKKARKILGYSNAEVEGNRIFEFLTDIDQETLSYHLESSNHKQVNLKRISFVKKGGIIIFLKFRLKPIQYGEDKDKKKILYIDEKADQIRDLKKNLNKYKNMIEHIPETVYSSLPDDKSTTIFLSKQWEDWTGIKVEKYLENEKLWIKTIHPEDREETLKKYRNAVANANEFHLEYRIVNKKTDKVFYIRDHGIPVKDSNGRLIRYDGVMTNITDLVLTEKELQKSEKKYRHLFQYSPYTIGLFSLDGVLLEVNEAANDLMSVHSIKDILGNHFSKIWSLNEKNRPLINLFENSFQKIKRTREPIELEFPIFQAKGGVKWLRGYVSLLEIDKQELIQFIFLDITKQKQIKKRLKKSEKKFRHLFQNSPYAIGLFDFNGVLLDINKVANKLMSTHSVSDIKGKHYKEIWTLNERNKPLIDLYDKSFQKLRDTHEPLEFEFPIRQTKGGTIWVHIYASIFSMEDQNFIQFILQDITEQKRTRNELRKSEKKFRHLFESSPYAIGLFTFDGILIDINKTANKFMSAHSIDDIIGMHYKEILKINEKNKPLIDLYEKSIRKLQINRKPLDFEFQIHQTQGKTIWFHIYASIFHLEGQKLIQFILNDITERKRSEKQLKEAQEKFRTISNQSFVAIVILQDNIFKYFNDEFLSVVGYSREEVNNWSAMEFLKVIHPKDREFVKEQALKKQAGAEDAIQNYEFRGITKNGETYWAEIFSKTVNYNGKPADLIITLDITEKKKTQRELKESETKYKTLFNSASDAILIHDLDANILEVNNTTIQRLGYTKEEFLNLSYEKYISPKYVSLIPDRIDELRKKGQAIFESEHITKDGNRIPIEVSLKLIEYNGQPAILNFSRDISERKKAERKLQESEEKFRTIAEQSVIGIGIYRKQKLIYLNKSFANIIERPYKSLKNSKYDDLLELIHPKDQQKVLDVLEKRKSGSKDMFNLVCRIITESNRMKWIEFTSKPISYQNGQAILGTIFDLTDQKMAEENLRKLNNLKSELLSRTSHELKTPLVSIKGFTNLVLEKKKNELSEETVSLIKEIQNGANRLEDLIKDILRAAELEFSKETLDKTEENLSMLVRSSIRSLKPLLKSRNLELNLDIHEKIIFNFDKEKILQVLENLLSNAIKYTPPGGSIFIKTEFQNNRCLLSIRDTGIGITKEEMSQLFTQFGKIEHYGTGLDVQIEGSGLGLFISKKIIDLHNGRIWAESEGRNEGSTFYLSLPMG